MGLIVGSSTVARMLSQSQLKHVNEVKQGDPAEMNAGAIVLAMILMLLYVFREKRRKNKYDHEKPRDPENRWGFPSVDTTHPPQSG